ncbi:MAG: hypothetical protein A2289_20425 [Deltaproteobacteria bacterium RIFOXYA12_FULL_58_15]|nr:MAG: hypothetical protein A2289_20425 [Deltaproteobacteria bacterium RIFOXYA12_FULL_58_15]
MVGQPNYRADPEIAGRYEANRFIGVEKSVGPMLAKMADKKIPSTPWLVAHGVCGSYGLVRVQFQIVETISHPVLVCVGIQTHAADDPLARRAMLGQHFR